MPIFNQRHSISSWEGYTPRDESLYFTPQAGFVERFPSVVAELKERVKAQSFIDLVATRREGREVLSFRVKDRWDRVAGWCLLVALDGTLPYLRVRPQGFKSKVDPQLGDRNFDDMFLIETEVEDHRSPLATGWLRSFVTPQIRQELMGHQAIDWTVCGQHLLHLAPGLTTPAQAERALDDDAVHLARIANLIPPALYQQFGQPLAASSVFGDDVEDTSEPTNVAPEEPEPGRGWPLFRPKRP